jgi:hypothetical protein
LYGAQASQVNISRGAVNRRFEFGVVMVASKYLD